MTSSSNVQHFVAGGFTPNPSNPKRTQVAAAAPFHNVLKLCSKIRLNCTENFRARGVRYYS